MSDPDQEEDDKPAPRSGTKWTEQDYAEHGYKRLTLRVPATTVAAFDEIAQALTDGNRSKAFIQIVASLSKK